MRNAFEGLSPKPRVAVVPVGRNKVLRGVTDGCSQEDPRQECRILGMKLVASWIRSPSIPSVVSIPFRSSCLACINPTGTHLRKFHENSCPNRVRSSTRDEHKCLTITVIPAPFRRNPCPEDHVMRCREKHLCLTHDTQPGKGLDQSTSVADHHRCTRHARLLHPLGGAVGRGEDRPGGLFPVPHDDGAHCPGLRFCIPLGEGGQTPSVATPPRTGPHH